MLGPLDSFDDPAPTRPDATDASVPRPLADEHQEGAPRQPGALAATDVPQMSAQELDDYFFHFDRIVQGKENIFTPLSFGLVPIVILKWEVLSTPIIAVAALVSGSLYYYMLRLIERFGYSQDRIWRHLEQRRTTGDFREITTVPTEYSVRRSRKMLGVILATVWILVILAAGVQKGLR